MHLLHVTDGAPPQVELTEVVETEVWLAGSVSATLQLSFEVLVNTSPSSPSVAQVKTRLEDSLKLPTALETELKESGIRGFCDLSIRFHQQ